MKLKCQRGAQIVEFAFALPFFVLMIFLIIDFGFLVFNKAVITNASREAARYATVLTATPWSTTAVAAVACNYARTSLISTRSGTHTTTCSGSADPAILVSNPNGNVPPHFGDPITVQITYVYSGFLTSTSTFILGVPAWNLITASKMNHE
jgi:Flp pilus assembly protein TadG